MGEYVDGIEYLGNIWIGVVLKSRVTNVSRNDCLICSPITMLKASSSLKILIFVYIKRNY